MRVILFGATGMVGQSALRECLLDNEVKEVMTIGRKRTNHQHEKLKEIELENVADYETFLPITNEIECFHHIGTSGKSHDTSGERRFFTPSD